MRRLAYLVQVALGTIIVVVRVSLRSADDTFIESSYFV